MRSANIMNLTSVQIRKLGQNVELCIRLWYYKKWQDDRQSIGLSNEALEITSLVGSISTNKGEPYLHLHINLAREDMSVVGGHLIECRLSATCEMFVREIDGVVERTLDDKETGLYLFSFL